MFFDIFDLFDNEYYKYQSFNMMWVIMMLYGSVASFYYVINAIDILMDLFVREALSFEHYGAGKVVTGCTDGIGKEMALQLADKGFNIILLSRTPAKLEKVKEEIIMKGVEARSYAVDFTKCTEVQWSEIKELVQQEEVSVLVNNVGLCHENPTFFDEEDQDKCNDMVEVNVNTMMDLTRIVVPQMQHPYELEPDGITVSHLLSFWVTSKMSGYREPTLSIPSPEQYVQRVFNRLGLKCGASDSHTTLPYYPHSILNFVVSCLWDPVLAIPAHYSIARNLYTLGLLRQQRRKARHALAASRIQK
ncbi:hypothetical protein GGH93_001056 [Coemansia aciculifera]|nr:hypothetical protein GGH93_001056 [Coemansia aciculifera]